MVYFVRKFRATSVPVFSRHEERFDSGPAPDVRLYSPQRSAAFVINDVNELSNQSKRHDRQFVDDVNNIINHANTALCALPPATKSKRRHHTTVISHQHHAGSPLADRRSYSHDENRENEMDDVRTPCTNSVLAKHRYNIQEKKIFSQPIVSEPLFKDVHHLERRNSISSDVACRQAQNTIDRVNQELKHRSGYDYPVYHNPPARHLVRSVSVSPYQHNMRRSPSPTRQTIVVPRPRITCHVILPTNNPDYRDYDLIGRRGVRATTSFDVVDPHYRSYDLIGRSVDPHYRSYDLIGRRDLPIYRASNFVRSGGSSSRIGYRSDPVLTSRSMSVGRLPTNHDEYAKMDTANFLSTAQAILDKPAIYSKNVASLPSIYSIGGPRHIEPSKTFVYKSFSNTAAPLVNSALNYGHVTSYTATPLVDLNLNSTHVKPYQPITAPTTGHTVSNYYQSGERVRAPLSEVRRRVRGVLCKVKKDPHYFG